MICHTAVLAVYRDSGIAVSKMIEITLLILMYYTNSVQI
jgi:hypothetical protein